MMEMIQNIEERSKNYLRTKARYLAGCCSCLFVEIWFEEWEKVKKETKKEERVYVIGWEDEKELSGW
jgi:hypothetical protein